MIAQANWFQKLVMVGISSYLSYCWAWCVIYGYYTYRQKIQMSYVMAACQWVAWFSVLYMDTIHTGKKFKCLMSYIMAACQWIAWFRVLLQFGKLKFPMVSCYVEVAKIKKVTLQLLRTCESLSFIHTHKKAYFPPYEAMYMTTPDWAPLFWSDYLAKY